MERKEENYWGRKETKEKTAGGGEEERDEGEIEEEIKREGRPAMWIKG